MGWGDIFFVVYHADVLPRPYSLHLMVDSLAFTIEAILFFVMSRALPLVQWRLFYWTVVLILCVDTVWAAFVFWTHRPEIVEWLIMNLIFLPLFIGVLVMFRLPTSRWGPI